ncbi:hypothetical protein MTR67_052172 [Solanum verrucosum]|uniref:Uncharacterized protein n=1 Tax=Solanum verrucosum TaxID=315347 RepID=A0AAF0ZZQ5_SOLVR|nr:hypothetical protein MTR67_052172 [Solanum verrucosum]
MISTSVSILQRSSTERTRDGFRVTIWVAGLHDFCVFISGFPRSLVRLGLHFTGRRMSGFALCRKKKKKKGCMVLLYCMLYVGSC